MSFQLNLEQLRKQAKERVRERRAAGQEARLADVQSKWRVSPASRVGPS